ncbi:hypothetical protein RvY_18171 [Ramazzottius varieornatus]|uniref:Uncharacterized protein n=1 Tax=Ramazzottius varieornatus TaxID=947166 RepID=A0A1D1WAS1_RAMVA|nr:hypothetical protein RvY_18171 [Ramazzottius varieornatus]
MPSRPFEGPGNREAALCADGLNKGCDRTSSQEGQLYVWGSPSSSVDCIDEEEMEAVMQPTKVQSKNTDLYDIFKVSAGASHAPLLGKKNPQVNGTS